MQTTAGSEISPVKQQYSHFLSSIYSFVLAWTTAFTETKNN